MISLSLSIETGVKVENLLLIWPESNLVSAALDIGNCWRIVLILSMKKELKSFARFKALSWLGKDLTFGLFHKPDTVLKRSCWLSVESFYKNKFQDVLELVWFCLILFNVELNWWLLLSTMTRGGGGFTQQDRDDLKNLLETTSSTETTVKSLKDAVTSLQTSLKKANQVINTQSKYINDLHLEINKANYRSDSINQYIMREHCKVHIKKDSTELGDDAENILKE